MKKLIFVICISFALGSTTALGNEISVSGKIARMFSSGNQFGGCMVNIPHDIQTCKAKWISLDCNGGYFQSAGERNYTTALAAFSLNRQVTLTVDDTKKYDGYCVASRIDLLAN